MRGDASAGESTGRDRAAGKYPVPVLAAAILAAERVSCLLVGSAALWLHGEPIEVGDTDAVIEPGEQNARRLSEALADMALRPRAVPPGRDFGLLPLVSVTTSYGRVDCLLERGRLDWVRLRQSAVTIPVADAGVLVAARADAWALRRQFKEKE
jgi:hypothetical protein